MVQRAGRLQCPRCGANNFDTVTSCWKCGAPLGAGAAGTPLSPPASAYPADRAAAPTFAATPMMPPHAPVYPGSRAEVPSMAYTAPASGDFGTARRAAILLALTIPWIGLPVGWIFMMIEDSRRQAIGRICAVWSTVALVFHLLLMVVMAQSMSQMLQQYLLPILQSSLRNSNGGGGIDNTPSGTH